MTYLTDDVWDIVKEFMLDWKIGWDKKIQMTFEDIKSRLPRMLIMERYDMKAKLYYITFRVPYRNGWKEELRVCNHYNSIENRWIDAFYSGEYSKLYDYSY